MITGVNARIKFNNQVAAYITNWSVDMQTALAEIVVLGSKDKTCLPMGQSWNASAEGLIMQTNNFSVDDETSNTLIGKLTQAFNDGIALDIDFELNTDKLSGKALIESLSFEVSAGEIPKVNISIIGASALALNPTVAE